jgi:chemotaxis protein histidine kinase CheA
MSRNNPNLDDVFGSPADTGKALEGIDKLTDAYKKLLAAAEGAAVTKKFKEASAQIESIRNQIAALAATPLEVLQKKISLLGDTLKIAQDKLGKAVDPLGISRWGEVVADATAEVAKYQAQIDKLNEIGLKQAVKEEEERESLRAKQYAAAVSALQAYQKEEAAAAKAAAKLVSDQEKLMKDQYAAATSAMKAYYAEEEKEAKAAAKADAKAWADLIETRKTLDAQAKKDIQIPAQAAKESAAGGAGGLGGVASGAIEGLGAVAGAAVAAAAAVVAMAEASAQFVKYSSPGAAQRLSMAFEDLYAAVGVMLEPVVLRFTQILDMANVAITAFQGMVEPVVDTLMGVVQEVAGEFIAFASAIATGMMPNLIGWLVTIKELWDASKPLVQALVDLTQALASTFLGGIMTMIDLLLPAFTFLADVMKESMRPYVALAAFITNMIEDLKRGKFSPGDAAERAFRTAYTETARDRSVSGPGTVAARPARQIGTEEIGQEARAAAFGSRSIQQQQLDEQTETNRILNRIVSNTSPTAPAPNTDFVH